MLCSIDECEKTARARGWCTTHYKRWQMHGDPLVNNAYRRDSNLVCSIDGCDKPVLARSWCGMHYDRWQYHGDPLMVFSNKDKGRLANEAIRELSKNLPSQKCEQCSAKFDPVLNGTPQLFCSFGCARKSSTIRYQMRKKEAFVQDLNRQTVLNLTEGFCWLCGIAVDSDWHLDHIIPIAKNGLHSYSNTAAAHPICNKEKSDKLPLELNYETYFPFKGESSVS